MDVSLKTLIGTMHHDRPAVGHPAILLEASQHLLPHQENVQACACANMTPETVPTPPKQPNEGQGYDAMEEFNLLFADFLHVTGRLCPGRN